MAHNELAILMAQINPTVGAIEANTNKIIQIIEENQETHDLIVFPELALSGYPLEDLVFRKELHQAVEKSLIILAAAVKNCHVIIGHPSIENEQCFNAITVFYQGKNLKRYHKQKLPNYGVFDEQRIFTPGQRQVCILELKQHKIGLCICEDLWQQGPVADLINQGATTLIVPNASPFDIDKFHRRKELLKSYAHQGVSIIYVNLVGGQDEIVFDGQSFAMDKTSTICARAPAFKENLSTVLLDKNTISGHVAHILSKEALIYKALVCGVHDYVEKNHFPGVLLGLSGGSTPPLL